MNECRYKLPCGWCDKFDEICHMAEIGRTASEYASECSHSWEFYATKVNADAEYDHYRCRICGKMKVIKKEIRYD